MMKLNIHHWLEYKFTHHGKFTTIQLFHQYMNDLGKHCFQVLNLNPNQENNEPIH